MNQSEALGNQSGLDAAIKEFDRTSGEDHLAPDHSRHMLERNHI
jgi:hypothetical protein